MIRQNYYVVDHTGDIWNVEPLPTLSAATQFRDYIRPALNRDLTLKIKSEQRPNVPVMATISKKQKEPTLFDRLEF